MSKNIDESKKNKKKVWTKKDYAEYFKESRELSDYTCSKNGVVKNKFKKKKV